MITSLRILIATALAVSFSAVAAPLGICLHAYGPDAPAEKIECFEYEKVERTGADYRFFLPGTRSVVVTGYRFRSAIPYKPGLAATHPDFEKLLRLYEETSRATPSTRAFLNPKILIMRAQVAQMADQKEKVAGLPTITLANGSKLRGCTMRKIEDGSVSIMHQGGISKVSLEELDATEKKALNATAEDWSLEDPSVTLKDSSGNFAKIVFKNGVLLKDATFKEVSGNDLVFMAGGKSISVSFDQFPGELAVLGEEAMKLEPQTKIAQSATDDSASLIEKEKTDSKPVPFHPKPLPKDSSVDVKLLWQAANEGYLDSQFKLGLCYANGDGVPIDVTEAAEWYRKAAEQGEGKAQYQLGFCYANGLGVSKDFDEALRWHSRSLDQDIGGIRYSFSFLSVDERGGSGDYKESVAEFRKIAEEGDARSQTNLGFCYAHGYGVNKDIKEAGRWFRMAADQGEPTGQFNLGQVYWFGDGVAEDRNEAMRWYRSAAEQGNADAQIRLAYGYRRASGVPKDYVEGMKWLRRAAEQGGAEHQYMLGFEYTLRRNRDNDEAVKWILKAANQGYVMAQRVLSRSYVGMKMGSLNVGRDDAESARWARRAADQGDAASQYSLGVKYAHGAGGPLEAVLAYKWYLLAARRGSEDANKKIKEMKIALTAEQIVEAQKLARDFKPILRGE